MLKERDSRTNEGRYNHDIKDGENKVRPQAV